MKRWFFLLMLPFSILLAAQTGVVKGLDIKKDDTLVLRTKPMGKEIERLHNGDRLTILAKKGKWYRVRVVKSGKVGWAHGHWIATAAKVKPPRATPKKGIVYRLGRSKGDDFLALRTKPMGKEIGRLHNGDRVTILAKRGKWYKVSVVSTKQTGWSHGHWIKVGKGASHADYRTQKKAALRRIAKEGAEALKGMSSRLKKERDVVLAAVKRDGAALQYADDSLKGDKEIVLTALKQVKAAEKFTVDVLEFAESSLKKDRGFIYQAVKEDGLSLKYAAPTLKKDRRIVLAAVRENGYALEYADPALKKEKTIVLTAVKNNGNALEYADPALKKDKTVVLAAVKQNGYALRYADPVLKKDKQIVLAAVQNYGNALKYADPSLKKEKEIVFAAVKQNSAALKYADDIFRKNQKVVKAAKTLEMEKKEEGCKPSDKACKK